MASVASKSPWTGPSALRAEAHPPVLQRRTVLAALLASVGYYIGSQIGFTLTFRPHPVSVLWPPNSILLAALLLTPVRSWWLIFFAVLPAHVAAQLQSHVPLPMILCYFISNSCEALIGAGCIRYFISAQIRFDTLRSTAMFCLFGGLAGPFLSSFLDAGFVQLNHWGTGSYWEIWRIRLFSNILTALTFAPAFVTWFADRQGRPKQSARRAYAWRFPVVRSGRPERASSSSTNSAISRTPRQPRFTHGYASAGCNNSTFHDFTKSVAHGGLVQGAIGPTVDGNGGFYLLADQQIWQSAPGSASTASRGLYTGATIMYARPQTTPITQYYEGRLYMKAPFESRTRDLVSLDFYYQVNSPYLVDNLNTLHAVGIYGKPETWSATVSYLARLTPGVYLTLGLNYTANPSQALYFGPSKAHPSQRFEGNAMNFQATLFTAF
jgi:hypothetical protein